MTYSIIQKSQLEGAFRLDAEYYQPEYLDISEKLKNSKTHLLSEIATIVIGPAYSSSEMGDNQDISVARIGDITRKTDIETWTKLSSKAFQKYGCKNIKQFDILMTMTGDPPDVGKCNIYSNQHNVLAYNQRVAKITPKIDAKFLFAYLSTEFARLQCERNALGIRQRNVATNDIRNIKVIDASLNVQDSISQIVEHYLTELEKSKKYYQQAEELLLKELGLDNFHAEQKLFSIVNLSDCQKANRLDAEYFQPKYEELVSKIRVQNHRQLGDLVSMKKGFEPGSEAYREEGKTFIRVSSLSKDGINENDQKYLINDLYNNLKNNFEPKVGEILLSKDATPGIAYNVKEPIEGIISSGILKLKLKTDIEPEYLTLCLNSIIGQMQAERDSGGSIIAHWKPEQIKNILIPILPTEIQQKIADLVRKSHTARQKSKELLEKAKKEVEELIERSKK